MSSSTITTKKRISDGLVPVPPGRKPAEDELREMMLGLPPMLRGTTEAYVHLGLPRSFVERWTEAGMGPIPQMPCVHAGDTTIYYTGRVLSWLCQWFPRVQAKRGGRRPVAGRKDEEEGEADGAGAGMED